MMRLATTLCVLTMAGALALAPRPARAGLHYYQDPLFQKVTPAEPHPMDDLISLAKQGDARAQYILGDLYGKGQGELGKNLVMARYWFEASARNGNSMAFIRLAALAKHAKNPVLAYQWYTLGKDAASWNSDERAYDATARDAVAERFKMTPKQISTAKNEARDWTSRRSAVMKQLDAQAKAARAESAKLEAAEKADGQTPDTDGDASNAPAALLQKAAPAPSQSVQPQQEYRYND